MNLLHHLQAKMKTQSLKNSQIHFTFSMMSNSFSRTEKPGTIAMDGAQISAELRKVVERLEGTQKELVEKYALRDADGNIVPLWYDKDGKEVPAGTEGARVGQGSMKVDPDKFNDYHAEWKAVLDKETEITTVTIPVAEMRALKSVLPDLLEAMIPFIDFDAPAPK